MIYFKLDHLGFITRDIDKFEAFWCGILGFEKKHESTLTPSMSQELFALPGPAQIRRYVLRDMIVEIHVFPPEQTAAAPQTFNRFGINHLCFHVEDRKRFLSELPSDVSVHVHHNVGGWDNVFINDFDGNWLELRETIK